MANTRSEPERAYVIRSNRILLYAVMLFWTPPLVVFFGMPLEHPLPPYKALTILVSALSGIVALILGTVMFLNHAKESLKERYCLIDLPWKRRRLTSILFVAVVPIAWPFYVVSNVHFRIIKHRTPQRLNVFGSASGMALPLGGSFTVHIDNRRQSPPVFGLMQMLNRPGSEQAEPFRFEPWNMETILTPLPIGGTKPANPLPNTARRSALTVYTQLRAISGEDTLAATVAKLTAEKAAIDARLVSLAEEMQNDQVRRGQVTAELREMSGEASDAVALSSQQAKEEFELLRLLPGVTRVVLQKDKIVLEVEARIQYKGRTYDLGNWHVGFTVTGQLHSYCRRYAVKENWTGGDPDYRLAGSHFCFGSRDGIIQSNLRKGQYLQAMEIAVNSVNSVNHKDLAKIPLAFEEVRP